MYFVQYHYLNDLINDIMMSLNYFVQVIYDYKENLVVNYLHIILMYVNLVRINVDEPFNALTNGSINNGKYGNKTLNRNRYS